AERLEAERLAAEKAEAERLEAERLEAERSRGPAPVQFSFWCAAGSVSLAGSFNGWDSQASPMQREGDHWTLSLPLSPGVYQYKYVVDGDWRVSPDHPTQVDSDGNTNNCIEVKE
ncbi:hypothetical protein KIPB_010689, partial [Kipferlia bialata]